MRDMGGSVRSIACSRQFINTTLPKRGVSKRFETFLIKIKVSTVQAATTEQVGNARRRLSIDFAVVSSQYSLRVRRER